MRRAAARTVTKWKTGTARKRRSQVRNFEPPPDSQIRARVENASVPIRGLFYANPRLYIISIANLSLAEYYPDRVYLYDSQARQSQLGPSHAARSSPRYRVRDRGQAITPDARDLYLLGCAPQLVRAKQEPLLHP